LPDTRVLRTTVVGAAICIIAFVITYFYAATNPLSGREFWYQRYMWPAVNLACTGHFRPIELANDATADDLAAYWNVLKFLRLRRLSLSCSDLPQHLAATNVLESADSSNVEQPIYLTLVYGALWRIFGLSWGLTAYLIAANAALSALLLYICCRRFAGAALAAFGALAFVLSPVFLENSLSPRDGIKFPFAIGVATLLIVWGTAACRTWGLLMRAVVIGLAIGVGYGFRSDLYLFLAPAAAILALLSRPQLDPTPPGVWRKAVAQLVARGAAVCCLVASFGLGAILPLLNDSVVHNNNGTEGYHVLAMGLFGITNNDLFLNREPSEPLYLYRNSYNNDLAAGVRIMEYAARRDNVALTFSYDSYFSYAKKYYLEIAKQIPADVIGGGIGMFVNVMTFPSSLRHHTNINTVFDRENPFSHAYGFVRQTWPGAPLDALDRAYHAMSELPLSYVFFLNVCAVYVLLAFLTGYYGVRAAAAAVVLLAVAIMVTSLKFEIRHAFYILSVLVVGWAAALGGIARLLASFGRIAIHRLHARVGTSGLARIGAKTDLSCIGPTTAIVAACIALTLSGLTAARAYQAHVVRSWLAAWVDRAAAPVEYQIVSARPGWSLVRILSPMADSRGGTQRAGNAPVNDDTLHMSVVAITLDGVTCDGRVVALTSIGDTNEPMPRTANRINEPFSVKLKGRTDYTSYMPAFGYNSPQGAITYYRGTEIADRDVGCIKSVKVVTDFHRDDLLFDFMVPHDLGVLTKDDLFKRVYLPGLGFL
jgi:hypothetical protein